MFLGDLIKEYRTKNKISQRDFAKKCNLSYTYISALEKNIDYRSGKPISPTLETIRSVAIGMSMSLDDVLKILDDEQPIVINNAYFDMVPVIGNISAGQPITAIENITGYIPIDPRVYNRNTTNDLFLLKVQGNSMNLKIKDGDYALISKQNSADNDDIVVAIVNGEDATLKKYKRLNEQFVMLEPMSTENFEPIMIDLRKDNFAIIGKMIGYFGRC